MVTKTKRPKAARRTLPTAAAVQERMLDTVHQVWLAGLGAVSKAQHGAPKLLKELIAEGARVDKRARGTAQEVLRNAVGGLQEGLNARVGQIQGQATDALDNLEKIFQTRVHRVLTQLGVPSAEAVEALSKRVDALNANIDKLARTRPAPTKPRKAAAKAPAAIGTPH